jgi:hypothetical protein
MARIRSIKPEFWQDEKLSHLSPIDRLVFFGLISQADDAGRLVDSVRLINGLLFPNTDDSCEESLETLASLGRIIRYEGPSGQRLLQITNWRRHQRIDNPGVKVLPGPPPHLLATEEHPATNAEPSRESSETQERKGLEDVGYGSVDGGGGNAENGNGKKDQLSKADLLADFEEIWAEYPKRAGGDSKREGYLAFRARRQAGATAIEILEGVRRYALYCTATDKIGTEFVKQLRTFLGKSRYYLEPWTLPRAAGAHSQSRRNAGEESYERGRRALQDVPRHKVTT